MGFPRIFSAALEEGAEAPRFTLADQQGNEVALGDLLAKGPVVVFFYPKDFTAVCTAEACSFRDAYELFQEEGAEVVGISADNVETHGKFAGKHKLPYPILSDPGGKVHKQFGLRAASLPGGISVSDRVTFVIDRDGIVRHTFTGQLVAQPHVEEALSVVRRLAGGGPSEGS